jgi:4'-phosphopantetheinyl transferase
MFDWNSIYVWRVGLESSASALESQIAFLRAQLSPEEQQRAEAFRGADHKSAYILTHFALRTILGQCLGIPAAAVRFNSSSGPGVGSGSAKPSLSQFSRMPGSNEGIAQQTDLPDLRFNLSHTHGAALVAVSMGREIGIDIEWQRPMDDLEGMARSVMSDREWFEWTALDAGMQERAFYCVWTRKESYLKAIGLGLYHPLGAVSVPVSPNFINASSGAVGVVDDRSWPQGGFGVGAKAWFLADIAVAPGYSASICCEGSAIPQIAVLDWDGFSCETGPF